MAGRARVAACPTSFGCNSGRSIGPTDGGAPGGVSMDIDRRAFLASCGASRCPACRPRHGGRMGAGCAAQDKIQALVAAYNASGQDLFRTFVASPGNIVFSPYSIGTAMAMALAGARSETEREMARPAAAPGARRDRRCQCRRARDPQRLWQEPDPPRCPRTCGSTAIAASRAPERGWHCPFPAGGSGEECAPAATFHRRPGSSSPTR